MKGDVMTTKYTILSALTKVANAVSAEGAPYNSVQEALKAIVAKLGGDESWYNNAELIAQIADNVSGGGGSIPENSGLFTVDGLYSFDGFNSSNWRLQNTLTSITLPDNVVLSVGNGAFNSCTKLESVNLSNVPSVYSNAFVSCTSLQFVDMPNVTSIEDSAFSGCVKLSVVNMPKVETIGGSGFSGSAIKKLYLPKVKTIGASAFSGCTSIENIYLGSDVTSIGTNAFSGAGYTAENGIVINCGFAEGAVSDAPWGAVNPTINYNVPDPTK